MGIEFSCSLECRDLYNSNVHHCWWFRSMVQISGQPVTLSWLFISPFKIGFHTSQVVITGLFPSVLTNKIDFHQWLHQESQKPRQCVLVPVPIHCLSFTGWRWLGPGEQMRAHPLKTSSPRRSEILDPLDLDGFGDQLLTLYQGFTTEELTWIPPKFPNMI